MFVVVVLHGQVMPVVRTGEAELAGKLANFSRSAPASVLHRRRINTEEKAKVFASVWGTTFIPFLAALAVLH